MTSETFLRMDPNGKLLAVFLMDKTTFAEALRKVVSCGTNWVPSHTRNHWVWRQV